MFIVYISGSDFGHLNSFYFSIILITLFDGFSNAFAFALNGKYASLVSAGIPISGGLVSILHNIYKFFSDSFHWDNFDYHVLRIQLLFNIITLTLSLILWSIYLYYKLNSSDPVKVASIMELFKSTPTGSANPSEREDAHTYDWVPIGMLAISLGTVYAFYPSIAPYSIIDYQYASVIELWILIISAIPTLLIAILDTCKIGPSSKVDTVASSTQVDFSGQQITFNQNELEVKHKDKTETAGNIKVYHLPSNKVYIKADKSLAQSPCQVGDPSAWHEYKTTNHSYTIKNGDKYWDYGKGEAKTLGNETVTFIYTYNWFQSKLTSVSTPASLKYNTATYTSLDTDPTYLGKYWNCVWFCAIFYILCIQIFMSMLHYPHSLLSCLFNDNPLLIGFISVLFNTLRETLQACGFSGAGKQCTNHDSITNGSITFDDYTISPSNIFKTTSDPTKLGDVKLTNTDENGISVSKYDSSTNPNEIKYITNKAEFRLKAGTSKKFKIPKSSTLNNFNIGPKTINGNIDATNKLITLFVMMFCVFIVVVNAVRKI